MNKNLPAADVVFKPHLPPPDTIYYKDFHFLDQPLIHKKPNDYFSKHHKKDNGDDSTMI